MTYKIYFSNRILVLDSDASKYDSDEVAYVTPTDPLIRRTKLLQKVQNTKRQVLVSEEVGELYRAVTDQFPSIEAGGGLVTNRDGDILMIFRHNRWDLPKGKLETDESIEECSVREVEEETGILGVAIDRKLLVTTHSYRLNGEWVMKKTTWFAMTYQGDATPVPQQEEDITAIEWVSPDRLGKYLQSTYPTILDVFEAAGYR